MKQIGHEIVAFDPSGPRYTDNVRGFADFSKGIDFYSALAETLSAAYQDYTFDPDGLRLQDERLTGSYVCQRRALLKEGKPIAFAEYRHTPEMHHPHKFFVNVVVHPDRQRQGLGSALYAHLQSELEAYQPISLRASCRADNLQSVVFLERRGFLRGMSILELHKSLTATSVETKESDTWEMFDPEDALRRIGITILTMDELATDAQRDWKLYQLVLAIRADMPAPEKITPVIFEHFVESFLNAPARLPDATFIAVRETDSAYIGFADLFADGDGGLYCGVTGVLRDCRRQGIASALKRAGIRYGYRNGYDRLKTFNAAENVGILSVNHQVGFREECAWLHFEKHFVN